MTNIFMIAAALITFVVSMTRSDFFYRVIGLFVTFSLIAILIFKDLSQAFLIIMVGLIINLLLAISYKGYGEK